MLISCFFCSVCGSGFCFYFDFHLSVCLFAAFSPSLRPPVLYCSIFLMVFHFCFLCHKHTSLVGKFQVKTTRKPSCSSAADPATVGFLWMSGSSYEKNALRVSRVKRSTDYHFCLCLLPFFFFTLCCILQRCE